VFQGEVQSVATLLEAARNTPAFAPNTQVGVRHTAADNASACRTLLGGGESEDTCWRFGILQTLDDYASVLRRGGPAFAAEVFADELPRIGSTRVDAAFAALADRLARCDGWAAPTWANGPSRRTDGWYPAVPAIFRDDADRESADEFRQRGILITARSLAWA